MIRLKILLITSVFFLGCATMGPGMPPGPPDGPRGGEMGFPRSVREYLSPELMDMVQYVVKGESYKVQPRRDETVANLAGFPLDGKGKDLSPDQLDVVKKMLVDPRTYLFETAKKSPFQPRYALKLFTSPLPSDGKQHEILVLLDWNDLLISVPFGGKARIEDFDPVKFIVEALLKELY